MLRNCDCALAMFVLPTVMQCASLSTVAAVLSYLLLGAVLTRLHMLFSALLPAVCRSLV